MENFNIFFFFQYLVIKIYCLKIIFFLLALRYPKKKKSK
jgi:hypothetical protein